MRLVWARVVSVERVAADLERLSVSLDGAIARAVCYPALTGPCSEGESVLVNATAVDLALGTGGVHFVVARAPDAAGGPVAFERFSGGHIMKLRYTPMQLDVLSVEEQGSPSHDVMAEAVDIAGMPVACCGLHSQLPLVAAAIKEREPTASVAYVMSDFAALPLALSDLVRDSVGAGLLDSTITCGQAFGGMHEAVNLHSGLLAARHVAQADVAIVAIGPGVVGTATPFGHGGIAQGEAINAVAALRGRPVAVLRLSAVDARDRHRGVSHHTIAALATIATARAAVALPLFPNGEFGDEMAGVDSALDRAGIWARHERVEQPADAPAMRGVGVTTMGRDASEDPMSFAAAYAAGYACAAMLTRDEHR